MKKTSILFLAISIVLIGVSSPLSAAEKPANYLAIKGGVYSPSDSYNLDNFNGGHKTELDSKTGFSGELAIGHYFIPMFAIELGAGYFESEGSPVAETGSTKLKVVPVLLTAKAILPLGLVEPYGEFGIGAYFTKLDVSGNLGSFSGGMKSLTDFMPASG